MHRESAMDISHAAVLMHPPLLVMLIFRWQCRCALARRLFLCPSAQLASRRKGRNMKIKYRFISETMEIKASNDWGDIVFELEHQEYNTNHKETYHHFSLEAHSGTNTSLTSIEVEGVLLSEKSREQRFSGRIKIFSQAHPVIAWIFNKVFLAILIDIIANITCSAIGQALFPDNVYEEPHSSSQVVYHIEMNKNVVVVGDVTYYYEVKVPAELAEYRYTGYVSKWPILQMESEDK